MEKIYLSKYGRATSRQFKSKLFDIDAELAGRGKKIQPGATIMPGQGTRSHRKYKSVDIDQIKTEAQENIDDLPPRPPSQCFQTVSRNDWYRGRDMPQAPDCALYNVKYNIVDSNGRHTSFGMRPTTASRVPKHARNESFDSMLASDINKSFVSFKKQIPRKNLHSTETPHEARFSSLPPEQQMRSDTPNFRKYTARSKSLFGNKLDESSPMYYPSMKAVSENLRKGNVKMGKQTHRPANKCKGMIDLNYKNVNHAFVEPRVVTPSMERPKTATSYYKSTREKQGKELPKFMRNMDTRNGLNWILEKSLDMSNYKGKGLTEPRSTLAQTRPNSPSTLERMMLYSRQSQTPMGFSPTNSMYKV